MPTDDEMLEWARQRDAHRRLCESPQRVKYMGDTRHPLRARRLDEPASGVAGPRRPFEPKPKLPVWFSPCAKCGEMVTLKMWWYHECLTAKP